MTFEYDKEALVYATQIGFIACRWPALKNHALAIFNAADITRPENPVGLIGKTMVYLNCDNDPKERLPFLRKIRCRAVRAHWFVELFWVCACILQNGDRKANKSSKRWLR